MRARFVKTSDYETYFDCWCNNLLNSDQISSKRVYSVEGFEEYTVNDTTYYSDYNVIDIYICPYDCIFDENDYDDMEKSQGGYWKCGECQGEFAYSESAADCCS